MYLRELSVHLLEFLAVLDLGLAKRHEDLGVGVALVLELGHVAVEHPGHVQGVGGVAADCWQLSLQVGHPLWKRELFVIGLCHQGTPLVGWLIQRV
jgi:hypothetical protein